MESRERQRLFGTPRWTEPARAAEQTQKTRRGTAEPKKKEEKAGSANIEEKGKKLKEDMDKLLDDIDEVLEENAEEFVKSYVQRGGE
ncbi:MAG: ubiquitin-like protein Pup [Deltaproteobacteria bacterium]|nr:ubiquitin-like protein Pup [Deltaproteobacteria bacterium]